MSSIEVQKPKQLDVLAQMAGKEHKLPAADLPDINLVIGTGTVAMVAAGALLAPGSLGNPVEVRAADPSTVVIGAECADFNGNGVPELRSTMRFFDYSDRIGQHFNAQTTITWDIIARGLRPPFASPGQNPDDTVLDFGNIPDLVIPYDTKVVTASPQYQQGTPYIDGLVTHTTEIPSSHQIVNPDGTIVLDASFRNYVGEDVITSNPVTVDCLPGNNPVPTEPNPAPVPPQPPVPPVNILKPGLKLTTAKILPKNGKGKLSITTSVSQDSTCSINGSGNGADKNIKNRRKAARIELKLQNATTVGKLPKGMIALKNNKPVKKGQNANMVSVDLRNAGLDPGERQASRFNYKLLRRAGKITAKVIIPANMSDCGARNMTSSLQLKSR